MDSNATKQIIRSFFIRHNFGHQRVGMASDRGGFELKEFLAGKLRESGCELTDFGDRQLKPDDDYPDLRNPFKRLPKRQPHEKKHSDNNLVPRCRGRLAY